VASAMPRVSITPDTTRRPPAVMPRDEQRSPTTVKPRGTGQLRMIAPSVEPSRTLRRGAARAIRVHYAAGGPQTTFAFSLLARAD
jgi:hypothetical protein